MLNIAGIERAANLEEIWESGAVVDCEATPGKGDYAEIRAAGVLLAGRVVAVEESDVGDRIEIHFSPLTPWSKELFLPDHFFDPGTLAGEAVRDED